MAIKRSKGERVFAVANYVFLSIVALLAFLPVLHIFAVSLSSSTAAASGQVILWPVEPTLASYKHILATPKFFQALGVTLQRLILGTSISMVLTVLTAYPLSKESRNFKLRTFFAWYFFITILFTAGLIPTFMVVKSTGLIGSIFALVLPCAVQVFNIILMLNFFRGIPKEIEEAAFIDGAGHWQVLFKMFIPISKPSLATVLLFTMVYHWNSWFDGLIYMNRPEQYPLQSYLQTVIMARDAITVVQSPEQLQYMLQVSERTGKSAQIFVAMLPILLVYPFLQKYFVKGIVLGSVKG